MLFQNVTAATISGAFVFGMVLVLLESIRHLLVKRLNLNEAQGEWLLAVMHVTLIPMMLLSGLLIDKFDLKAVLMLGSLVTAVAVVGLAVSETRLHLLCSVLILGAGGACLSTSSSVLMLYAFYPDHAGASQNLGNVFFALGALVSPTIAQRLLERLTFRRALSLLAAACLLPAFFAVLTTHEAFGPPRDRAADLGIIFHHPMFWLVTIVFLFYGPIEATVGTWAERYLNNLGFEPRRGNQVIAGFWLAFLAARLLAAFMERSWLTGDTAQGWFIIVLALGSAVALGNVVGARKGPSAALGLILVGAFFGPIFPTLVGILFDYFKYERGTAFGAMFALGSVGNLFLPPFVGWYARRSTPQRAMRIPMILALALALAAFVMVLYVPIVKSD